MSECRLSVAKSVWDDLIPKIDANKFLALSKDSCDRAELFLFALALGLENKAKGKRATARSLVRPASLKTSWSNILSIAYLASLGDIEKEVHTLGEDEPAVEYCNAVADAGFAELEQLMADSTEVALESLTTDMDDQYRKIRDDYPELDLPELAE